MSFRFSLAIFFKGPDHPYQLGRRLFNESVGWNDEIKREKTLGGEVQEWEKQRYDVCQEGEEERNKVKRASKWTECNLKTSIEIVSILPYTYVNSKYIM